MWRLQRLAVVRLDPTADSAAQIFGKGTVHATVRVGSSTFKTRSLPAASTVSWQETGYLYIRCVLPSQQVVYKCSFYCLCTASRPPRFALRPLLVHSSYP